MLLGIFSDIHSNIQALQAVNSDMESRGVEKKVCLGDLVGYGGNPNECVDMVRSMSEICILGNHDSVAIENELPENFNPYALKVMNWTREILTTESLDYLKNLQYKIVEHDCLFVHSSPKSPADWCYVSSLDDAVDAFEFFKQQVCFIGHTHCPNIIVKESGQSFKVLEESEYTIIGDERVLVNVGSVGQPRDRDPQASYCTFNTETKEMLLIKVPYDIEAAQQTMIEHDLPEYLVNRLSEGR
ncbi:MAG: metallophosphatase family protein [Fibrobacterales bacterium]